MHSKLTEKQTKTIVVDAAASDAFKVKIKAVVLDNFKVLFAVGPCARNILKPKHQYQNIKAFHFKSMLGWKLNRFRLQMSVRRVGEKGLNHGGRSHPSLPTSLQVLDPL